MRAFCHYYTLGMTDSWVKFLFSYLEFASASAYYFFKASKYFGCMIRVWQKEYVGYMCITIKKCWKNVIAGIKEKYFYQILSKVRDFNTLFHEEADHHKFTFALQRILQFIQIH